MTHSPGFRSPAANAASPSVKVNLSRVFAGQQVGVRQVDEHIWLVTFMHFQAAADSAALRTITEWKFPNRVMAVR